MDIKTIRAAKSRSGSYFPQRIIPSITQRKHSSVSSEEIRVFTRYLATVLSAGMPLIQGLTLLEAQTNSVPFKTLVRRVRFSLQQGHSFAHALSQQAPTFDTFYCSLVLTGEHSGTLDTVLSRLATYQEQRHTLRQTIRKALYYPISVLFLSIIVIIVLLRSVIPSMQQLFITFQAELPYYTRLVINIASCFNRLVLPILLPLCGSSILFFWRYPTYRKKFFLCLPFIGSLQHQIWITQLTQTLAITTKAGVPLIDALRLLEKMTPHTIHQTSIAYLLRNVLAGEYLSESMKKNALFSPLVIQLISIGEHSGTLDAMFSKIASLCEHKVNQTLNTLTTLLEPTMMILLGVLIGGIVIAMYLPIFSLGDFC